MKFSGLVKGAVSFATKATSSSELDMQSGALDADVIADKDRESSVLSLNDSAASDVTDNLDSGGINISSQSSNTSQVINVSSQSSNVSSQDIFVDDSPEVRPLPVQGAKVVVENESLADAVHAKSYANDCVSDNSGHDSCKEPKKLSAENSTVVRVHVTRLPISDVKKT